MILTQTRVPLYHDPAIHYSITFPSSLQTLVFSRNFPLLVKVSKKKSVNSAHDDFVCLPDRVVKCLSRGYPLVAYRGNREQKGF